MAVPWKQRLAQEALLRAFLLDTWLDSLEHAARELYTRTGVDVTPQCIAQWRSKLVGGRNQHPTPPRESDGVPVSAGPATPNPKGHT